MMDSGVEGPGFNSQLQRCRVTVLGKLFTPIVYDSRHLQTDCQEPGSAPEPYAR